MEKYHSGTLWTKALPAMAFERRNNFQDKYKSLLHPDMLLNQLILNMRRDVVRWVSSTFIASLLLRLSNAISYKPNDRYIEEILW